MRPRKLVRQSTTAAGQKYRGGRASGFSSQTLRIRNPYCSANEQRGSKCNRFTKVQGFKINTKADTIGVRKNTQNCQHLRSELKPTTCRFQFTSQMFGDKDLPEVD